jgi:flagellin
MTRINTNVSSLVAQKSLSRSNTQLQEALTRLSTGLRINSGRDDPAGLIASETLRADIKSVETAISNSQMATQMIATADSALGQVSSLLNDIRGLVTEAANAGALSDEQIAANQLQVDSSLEAINQIAQTTMFQGRKLLDGNLDFISTAASVATIVDVQIDQANLGATGQIDVDVDVAAAAAKAAVTTDGFSAAANANATLDFAAGAFVDLTNADFDVWATSLGTDEDNVPINIVNAVGPTTATYSGGTLTISADATDAAVTVQDLVDAINASVPEFQAALVGADGDFDPADAGSPKATTDIATLQIQANNTGPEYNNMGIRIETATGHGAATAAYDATLNELVFTVDDAARTLGSELETAITGDPTLNALFTPTWNAAGNARPGIQGSGVDVDGTANTDVTGGGALNDDLVVEIGGNSGSEVFNFESGAGVNQIASAINLVSDSTGVEASYSGITLTLNSTDYGSNAFVDVNVISEGSSGTFKDSLSDTRDAGSDVEASVNGITADADGNELSINTSTLDLRILVMAGSSSNFDFSITGGGALFQIGPDVVSNQQARLGIASMNTARLRGASGRLYQLGSGEDAALATDPNTAGKIVDQVISKVAALRGRLGAFQKTTLQTNINALKDTIETLTEAESSIRDADFAAETAALTRAQILVQSGTSVLAIANTNPQNVLALLR